MPAPGSRTYRGCLPAITHDVTIDGRAAVVVELEGAHGRGHSVTVDADAWERVKRDHGDLWTRERYQDGRWHVASLPQREIKLARAVMEPVAHGSVIRHGAGGYLDCRRCNLTVGMGKGMPHPAFHAAGPITGRPHA